jgi:hypothetical protein
VASPALDNGRSGRKAARRSRRRQRWFAFWLLFTGEPPAERRRLLRLPPKNGLPATEEPWKRYKAGSLKSASRRRAYLHASRGLGVATAVLIAMLAVLAVVAGTIAPAPSEVIVIHDGRSPCVSAADSGKLAHVSRVVPVNSC